MRVLHVLNTNRFSGAENVVCQIIDMFKGDSNIDMAYASPDGKICDALLERDITFFPMSKLCHSELNRIVNEYKPDVIHGHDIRGAYQASRFSRKAKIIHTIHGNDRRMRKVSVKSMLYYWAATKAAHIFWVSKTCLEQYKFYDLIKDKSSLLCNVVNADAVAKKSASDSNNYEYNVVYIGRITDQKNPQRLMKVLKLAIGKKSSINAAIVGTGDLETETKEIAKKYKIEDHVHFLGFQSNPLKILASSKVMIMTSDWEGTPMVALEAMSLGVPIVTTPTDGLAELITDGYNGILSDNDDELAQGIISILEDNSLHKRLSSNQIARSKEINDIEKYKRKIRESYGLE